MESVGWSGGERSASLDFLSYAIFSVINGADRRSYEKKVEELRKIIASMMQKEEPRLLQEYGLSHEEQNLISSDMDGTEFSAHAGKMATMKKSFHSALAHVMNVVTTFVH